MKKTGSIPNYPKKHSTNLETETGAIPIPDNIFIKQDQVDVFNNEIKENHKWEQFFWTKQVVEKIVSSLKYIYIEKTCCLATPSIAHRFHEKGRDEILLEIDRRFDYLPKFHYFDIRNPTELDDDFRLLVIDPPFFVIPIEEIRKAVDVITNNNYKTKILIAFLKRAEKRLRIAFADYNLIPTNFKLEYRSIKPNKWNNFVLYSNVDLPNIKRINEKKKWNSR